MMWGKHCLKTWSSTQATVALSSAEAELYALTKGASQGLGMMTLLADFGLTVSVTVHTDASAAIGIVRRAGIGKLRHLNVRYLWVQDQVKSERLGLKKVAGADNPADIATKHLNADIMRKHLESLGVRVGGGRARSAPILGSLGRRGRRKHKSAVGPKRSALGGLAKVGAKGGGLAVASSGKATAAAGDDDNSDEVRESLVTKLREASGSVMNMIQQIINETKGSLNCSSCA